MGQQQFRLQVGRLQLDGVFELLRRFLIIAAIVGRLGLFHGSVGAALRPRRECQARRDHAAQCERRKPAGQQQARTLEVGRRPLHQPPYAGFQNVAIEHAQRVARTRQRHHSAGDAHDRAGVDAGIHQAVRHQLVAGHFTRAFDFALHQPDRRVKTDRRREHFIQKVAAEVAPRDVRHFVPDRGGQHVLRRLAQQRFRKDDGAPRVHRTRYPRGNQQRNAAQPERFLAALPHTIESRRNRHMTRPAADLPGAHACPRQPGKAEEDEQEVAAQQECRRGFGERNSSGNRRRRNRGARRVVPRKRGAARSAIRQRGRKLRGRSLRSVAHAGHRQQDRSGQRRHPNRVPVTGGTAPHQAAGQRSHSCGQRNLPKRIQQECK